jgi:hypothetical protein
VNMISLIYATKLGNGDLQVPSANGRYFGAYS